MASSSGASVSSYGSGVEDPESRGPNPGDDSEPWEDAQPATTGLFGVLYTVSKEKETTSWRFLIFKLALDFLQLFLLTVNPQYGYDIDSDSKAWKVASFIQLNTFMSERGYSFFVALMYLMAAGLVINVGLCAWVGHSFQSGKFDHVWPIVLLRYYSLIFYQVLDVASLTLFLITLDCQYFDVPDEMRYRNQEFPTVECWSMPHMIHVAVASVSFVVFVSLATLFSMAELQLNPLTKNYLAMAHSKVEVISFGMKVVMTLASVFVTNIKWLSVVYLAASAYLLWLWLLWCPHVYDAMNYVRVGTYASICYTALITFVMAFRFGADTEDPDALQSFKSAMTKAMWAGLVPTGILGAIASYFRLRFFRVTLVQRFRTSPEGAKPQSIYRFTDPRQVEITARCCRHWIDTSGETLDPDLVDLAEHIVKAGLQLMPAEPFMIIWYSSFLIDVQGSYQSGYTQLQIAKKHGPSLLERFAIFSREQEHAQKASSTQNGESAVDLVSYVEFQRNHRLCLRTHKESLLAMRAFWQHLLHSRVKFEALARCIHRIEVSVKQAERVYRMVLQRHSNSVKILKLYARFLEGVKQNPWDAAKWLAEAERLELLEEEHKDHNAMGDIGTYGGGGVELDESSRAVIAMSATGIIQVANKAAHAMFGYSKNELKLKNVSLLMPEPFSSKHTAYVRAHISAGKESGQMLNRANEMIGLHREKHVFPVSVFVTKVSGIGEDSMFMGILEPLACAPNSARMWVLPSGAIMAVDPNFTDWFGYTIDDMVGLSVDDVAADSPGLQDIISRAKRNGDMARDPRLYQTGATARRTLKMTGRAAGGGNGQYGGAGADGYEPSVRGGAVAEGMMIDIPSSDVDNNPSTGAQEAMAAAIRSPVSNGRRMSVNPAGAELRVSGVRLKHKFTGQLVEVEAAVANGGAALHTFQVVALRRTSPEQLMMVVDRKGQLVHLTSALASLLGTTPKALIAVNTAHALDALMPQPFGLLHHALLKDYPLYDIPPHSCRSGIPVALRASTPDGPRLRHFRLRMKRRDDLGPDTHHVVALEPVSEEQALSSRRLVLRVDGGTGTVTSVVSGGTPPALFGFEPLDLLGRSVSAFIDNLRSGTEGGDDGPAPGSSRAATAAWTLLELARRSFDSEGPVSVRVGVTPPLDEAAAASMGPMAQSVIAKKTRPAFMAVQLHVPRAQAPSGSGKMPAAAAGAAGAGGAVDFPDRDASILMCPTPVANSHAEWLEAAHGLVGADDAAAGAAAAGGPRRAKVMETGGDGGLVLMATPPPGGAPSPSPVPQMQRVSDPTRPRAAASGGVAGEDWRASDALAIAQQAALVDRALAHLSLDGGVMRPGEGPVLEITLWRSDLLVGVLELDAEGKVVAPPPPEVNPLTSAAMLLGLPDKMLRGVSVRALLPLGSRPITDLYEPNLGQNNTGAGRKGGLKTSKSKHAPKPGAVNTLRVSHLGDGQEMTITVQAVPKAGSATQMYLVMRQQPAAAANSRPDLSLLSPRAAAAAGPPARVSSQSQLPSPAAVPHAHSLPRPSPLGPLLAQQPVPAGPGARMITIDSSHSFMRLQPERNKLGLVPEGGEPPSPLPVPRPPMIQTSFINIPSITNGSSFRNNRSYSGVEGGSVRPGAAANGNGALLSIEVDGRQPANMSWSGATKAPAALNGTGGSTDPDPSRGVRFNGNGDTGSPALTARPSDPKIKRIASWVESGGQAMVVTSADDLAVDHPEQANGDVSPPPPPDSPPRSNPSESEGGGSDDDVKNGDAPAGASGGNDVSDVEDEAATAAGAKGFTGDYRRGKRFRKLTKMLGSSQATKMITTFKWHFLAVIACLLLADLVAYIVMELLVAQQRQRVVDLHSVAMACRRTLECLLDMKSMEVELANVTIPGLFYREQIPDEVADLEGVLQEFRELHRGVYLGFNEHRSLPEAYGLRAIWDDPTINITTFLSTSPNMTVNSSLYGLWDAGNLFLKNGLAVQSDLMALGSDPSAVWDEQNPALMFVHANGPFNIWDHYLETIDAYGSLTISQSNSTNAIQLILLLAEGCALCTAAVLYIWYLTQRVADQRYGLYAVFMSIPQGLTRSLANMSVALDAEDEDEELQAAVDAGDPGAALGAAAGTGKGDGADEEAGPAGLSLGGGGGTATKRVSMAGGGPDAVGGISMKLFGTSRSPSPVNDGGSKGRGLAALFRACFGSTKVAPTSKRQLIKSYNTQIWLVWPFVIWGIAVIIANTIGRMQLGATPAPIATLDVVNSVLLRFHRTLYLTLQLVANEDVETKSFYREHLREEYGLWTKEYKAMVFGGKAVDDPDPHFAEATSGVIDSGGEALNLLYYTNDCMCEDPADCQPEDSPYYKITRNGLDVLLKAYFSAIETIIQSDDASTNIYNDQFEMVWAIGQSDVENGLQAMSLSYLDFVDKEYSKCLTVHVAIFALSWVLSAALVVFMLRPFISSTSAESRRIAELLSQLPAEVDVEGLVARAIANNSTNIAAAPKPGASIVAAPDMDRGDRSHKGGGNSSVRGGLADKLKGLV